MRKGGAPHIAAEELRRRRSMFRDGAARASVLPELRPERAWTIVLAAVLRAGCVTSLALGALLQACERPPSPSTNGDAAFREPDTRCSDEQDPGRYGAKMAQIARADG